MHRSQASTEFTEELSRFKVHIFQRLAPFTGLAFEDCSRCMHSFKLLSAFLKCGRFGKEPVPNILVALWGYFPAFQPTFLCYLYLFGVDVWIQHDQPYLSNAPVENQLTVVFSTWAMACSRQGPCLPTVCLGVGPTVKRPSHHPFSSKSAYKGLVLLPMAMDGAGRISLFAFGCAPSETNESWLFFVKHIGDAMNV